VATDIPADRLPGLIEAAGSQKAKVAAVGFTPPDYNDGWSSGYPIPNVIKIQAAVRRLIRPTAVTTSTQPEPDGIGGPTATSRAPATARPATSGPKPACATAG
jgi:hypothetical protein